MANVKILGDVFQIKSTLTEKAIKKAESYDPNILKLKDKDGNELFAVGLGNASISKYGICFGATDENDGRVFATIEETGGSTLKKEDIVENFATVLLNLNRIEKQVQENMELISAAETELMDNIEVM